MRHLTETMIQSGKSLLRMLRKQRFPFRAALWLYLSEAEEWQLVLAVPRARAQGKMKFYKRLQDTLRQESHSLVLNDLSIVDANDPVVYAVGPGIKAADVARHEFSRGTINGRSFDDAYIYRPTA